MYSKLFILSLVCLLAPACFVAADEEEVTELKIEVLHKPDKCERAAAKADYLSMHYRGSLLNGQEFDSR